MMEGTLERKHVLQAGGRKVRARLRGWDAGMQQQGDPGFGVVAKPGMLPALPWQCCWEGRAHRGRGPF